MSIYDFTMKTIDGLEKSLNDYKGRVLLVVNVASECGLTPQYEGLQELHDEFANQPFEVLGFPANQFGAQEPGSDYEIKSFCTTRFGVKFPMFSKIIVKGEGIHPLYQWLTSESANPDGHGEIQWNFQKYLIGKDGQIAKTYKPQTEPGELVDDINELLKD